MLVSMKKWIFYANEKYANMQSACFCVYLKKLPNTLHLTPYLWKWVEWFLLCYLKQCLSNILKIWGNYPLGGVIIHLIKKKLQCRHGFSETRENKLWFYVCWQTIYSKDTARFKFGVTSSYRKLRKDQWIAVLCKWANLHIYSVVQKENVKPIYVKP